jgi:hypothetical protein
MAKAQLNVVPPASAAAGLPPPPHLAGAGRDLWARITALYAFDDPGSYEVLSQACFATTRADRCRAIIDDDGEMISSGKIIKAHPLMRDEVANRALACRLLQKLGLDLEPIHDRPGRPSSVA